jgi:putative peptidoglycan lipid II flippase
VTDVAEPSPVDAFGSPRDAVVDARSRRARNTVFFALGTGLGRIAGLVREVVAAKYFGVTGPMSAFTIGFQIPNLLRALFADSALQGAFVPVFAELLDRGERREAFKVASSLLFLICLIVGGLTALLILLAPVVVPLLAPGFTTDVFLRELTVNLTRVMMPTVLLLALSGLVAGMLNSFDQFTVPAVAPAVWNLVIVIILIVAVPFFPPDREIYAYAVGVLSGTIAQLAVQLPWLRRRGGRITLEIDWRSPAVRRVGKLMLPVTLTLGLFHFSLLINSLIGTLVQEEAPAAIDRAFRVIVLPQGIFSVAIMTVLYPTLSRLAARRDFGQLRRSVAAGAREICLFTIPSAVFLSVLALPITRLLYERGAFDAEATRLVGGALAIWAVALPFQGVATLFSQTFFTLRRAWTSTGIAGTYVVANAGVALALHGPLGVDGIVLATGVANVAMTACQAVILRRELGGLEGWSILSSGGRMAIAASALAAVSYSTWYALDHIVGRSLGGQIVAIAGSMAAGGLVYALGLLLLGEPESRRIRETLARTLRPQR